MSLSPTSFDPEHTEKPSYHLLTNKKSSQESLRSYVQRFNAESLKVDIPDEKFAITTFIVGLGVQSKDLMFSISKNPQASMAEVLAKAEKYIRGLSASAQFVERFNSGRPQHLQSLSSSVLRAQLFYSGHAAQESVQLRQFSP